MNTKLKSVILTAVKNQVHAIFKYNSDHNKQTMNFFSFFTKYKSMLYNSNWIKVSSPETQAGKHSITNVYSNLTGVTVI